MAEAGRKVLLDEFTKALAHEVGTRTDADPEDVHDMRVGMRRMRSAFHILRPYYKKRQIRRFGGELGELGTALGEVRDLDVLVKNLRDFQPSLDESLQDSFNEVMNELERQRMAARQEWVAILDSRNYAHFLKAFGKFLTSEGVGAKGTAKSKVQPTQIRHVLPGMIYEQLASVLAYDTVMEDMDATAFHTLRIAFKRLRYTITLFQDLLGSQSEAFVEDLKAIQDCLGEMHDGLAARERLLDLPEELQQGALAAYLAHLDEKESALRAHFFVLWAQFNSKRVQQRLASAVVALR